jgi:hypothetical protein
MTVKCEKWKRGPRPALKTWDKRAELVMESLLWDKKPSHSKAYWQTIHALKSVKPVVSMFYYTHSGTKRE